MNKLKRLFIKRNIKDILRSIKLLAIAFFCMFIKNREKYKDIWMIDERASEARDNGYWLFKYIMDNKLHDNVWYTIEDNSVDAYKLEKYSHRIIKLYSIRHYVYYCLSTRGISAHKIFGSPSYVACKYFKRLMPVKKTYIYLGHGIHKDNVDFLYKKSAKIDLFITDSDIEANELIKVSGYDKSNVAVTGRPRNDGLHDFKIEKEILLMPTNRIWFLEWTKETRSDNFLKSRFYNEYQALLDDITLHKLLKETGYKLLFYLHPNTQYYLELFKSECKEIIIVSNEDMDIQEVLKRTALLVTDYSSVAFDFSYMGKPSVYFQYDYENFRENQYSEGWFSYKKHGVGAIVDNRESLIDEISKSISNKCMMDEKYQKRAGNIYKYHDADNCKRVFNSIIDIKK